MKHAFSETFRLWVLPGLLAGIAFLGIALLSGALTTSVWAMPDAVARTVGIAAPADYRFALLPVAVGILIHLALSIGLGALLAAIAQWRRLRGGMVVAAAFVLITLETPIVLWGILHTMLPATTFHYYLAAVPLWGSVLGHYLYALVLGLLLATAPLTAVSKAQQQRA